MQNELCMLPPQKVSSLQVYKGRRKYTGQLVALKFILKHGKTKKDLEALRQEINILKTLQHENIIRMLDSFETDSDICVVTEFAQGMSSSQVQNHTGIEDVCLVFPFLQRLSSHL